jgi:hypothetical protein
MFKVLVGLLSPGGKTRKDLNEDELKNVRELSSAIDIDYDQLVEGKMSVNFM